MPPPTPLFLLVFWGRRIQIITTRPLRPGNLKHKRPRKVSGITDTFKAAIQSTSAGRRRRVAPRKTLPGTGRRTCPASGTRPRFFPEGQLRVHLCGQPVDTRGPYDGLYSATEGRRNGAISNWDHTDFLAKYAAIFSSRCLKALVFGALIPANPLVAWFSEDLPSAEIFSSIKRPQTQYWCGLQSNHQHL